MDDYEEDIEIDPLGIVEFPNIKKNVDIISQCSLPQLNTNYQKINPRNRRNTVFFQNKVKGTSMQAKNSDTLFSGSPPQAPLASLIPNPNSGSDESSPLLANKYGTTSKEKKIMNEDFRLKKEKIVNSNSIDSLYTYNEQLNHNEKSIIATNNAKISNLNNDQRTKVNDDSGNFISSSKASKSYNIQVPQFDFTNLLNPNIKIKHDQLVGILSSLNAQITKEKMDLDDFLNEAEMHMNSINEITDKLYSHRFYDANFLREEAIRNVIFQQIALKRCNSLQICSRYNIQLIDNFMSFLNNISKKSFKLSIPDVDLDTFLSKYLMNYDDPRLELTKLDRRLSCIVSQIEYLKTRSLPPENSTQMKHSRSYSKKNNNINSNTPRQVDISKANSNSIQSTPFSKVDSESLQQVSFSQSNLIQPISFYQLNSGSDSLNQINLTTTSSNFDNFEIITNKSKAFNDFEIINDSLGRMHMFKPFGKTDFVSSFLSPEKKSGRIISRFLSRITEMTYSDLDMIITAVLPHPSYHIKVRSLLFDLAWQRMEFPFAAVTHLQFPDILDFTPRSLFPMYLRDEYLDTPFNKLNNTLFKRKVKKKEKIIKNGADDNTSMDDINNNIQKAELLSNSSNETIQSNNQTDSSNNFMINKNSSEISTNESITTTSIDKIESSLENIQNESSEKIESNTENISINSESLNNSNYSKESSYEKIESSTENLTENEKDDDDDTETSLWPFAFTKDYFFVMMCCTNPFTIANRFCEMIQIVANVLQSLAFEESKNNNESEDDIEIGFDNIFPVLLTSVYAFGCPGILDALEYCGQFVDYTTDPQQKFAMTHCNGIVEQIRRTRTEDFKRRAMKNKNQLIFAVHK